MGIAAVSPLGGLAHAVGEALAVLRGSAPRTVSSAGETELLAAVADLGELHRLVETAAVLAAEVEQRSFTGLGNDSLSYRHGFKPAKDLLAKLTRLPERFVQEPIRAGEAIAPLSSLIGGTLPPKYGAVADAAFTGVIGVRSVVLITRMLGRAAHLAAPEQVAAAEHRLVE